MLTAKWSFTFLHLFLSNAVFQSCGTEQRLYLTTRASPAAAPKLVFAHFIAGLTINYTRDDWKSQIALAASHGIDAFALNVGTPDSWQVNQVATAYDVATGVIGTTGNPFKLFLSLDMSVIQTASQVKTWVTRFAPMKAQLLVEGKAFISTFSGENNAFGANNLSDGWKASLKDPLAAMSPPVEAAFVPVWSSLNPSTAVSTNPVVDGIMTWKAWPTGNDTTSTTTDLQFQADAKRNGKLFMASVSPCFYTHYPDKNFLFKSDDNLYVNRWKELIAMPTQPDFIQIVSWNDYGESHYIGPMAGSPPAGTNWLSGFDHQSWLDMTDYFITWYKTGSPPAITQDKVYYNYRPHAAMAVASSDPLGPPTNASVSRDAVHAAVFLTSDSTARQLRITIGNSSQSFDKLTPGSISTFSAPWSGDGGDVRVELLDGSGKALLTGNGQVSINNEIRTYNFNYASELLKKGGGSSSTYFNSKSHANSNSPKVEIISISNISALVGITVLLLSYF